MNEQDSVILSGSAVARPSNAVLLAMIRNGYELLRPV
jgi:hypothetical protein